MAAMARKRQSPGAVDKSGPISLDARSDARWEPDDLSTPQSTPQPGAIGTGGVPHSAPPLRYHLQSTDVPEWLVFPYIHGGYRLGGDYWSCVLSLFVLHNECLNAWTLLLGGLLSTLALAFVFSTYDVRGLDASAFVVFWFSLIAHMPFSVGYHTFLPISAAVCARWRRLDITFSFLMAVQLTYSMSYFVYGSLYGTLLATSLVALLAAKAIAVIHSSHLERRQLTRLVGLSTVGYYLPVVFWAAQDAWRYGTYGVPALAALVLPASLVGGAYIYETHMPECFWPGKLDLVVRGGNSHLWLHFGVITAHMMGFCFVLHGYLHKTGQVSPRPTL
ncbi:ADIPOR-like receptor [Tetrabaena socialis]|uniref:ADIPOR-like receptor n=1 Tax=Tetrabaena socialis TaxID=47790 RepID=A0A2J8A314_9CHLO|nr:ADIPOR-like receptor [Tetrabaena socialis]|eukprot:PNH06906.1 ADIPOR-like receptor [Tetrabaena socialis]